MSIEIEENMYDDLVGLVVGSNRNVNKTLTD